MIVAAFLVVLFGALGLGAWIGIRIYSAQSVVHGLLDDFDRDQAINDEAEFGWTR
jgi:hypothetical protein